MIFELFFILFFAMEAVDKKKSEKLYHSDKLKTKTKRRLGRKTQRTEKQKKQQKTNKNEKPKKLIIK